MSKSRPQLAARHLVVHRLDSTLPFAAAAAALEAHLQVRPELGLFVDAEEPAVLRVGGIDLLTLDAHAGLVARLDDPATPSDDAEVDAGEADEAAEAAAPLALAIDLDDGGAGDEGGGTAAAAPTASDPAAQP